MNLCTFSKSQTYERSILPACPLGLNFVEGKECLCRKRVKLPNELRVITCMHPYDYRGLLIKDPERIAAFARSKVEKKREDREVAKRKSKREKGPTMAEDDSGKEKVKQAMEGSALLTMDRKMAIAVYNRVNDVMKFVDLMGKSIYASKMFGCANIEQGQILALTFMIEGRSPVEYKRTYHMVGGNLTMRADAMLAEFNNRGGVHEEVKRDATMASIKLKMGKRKEALYSFSWDEASIEEYPYTSAANDGRVPKKLPSGEPNPVALKDNWKTPRKRAQMLWARVTSDAVRAYEPACCAGFYTPEEFDLSVNEDGEIIDVEFEVKGTTPAAESSKPEQPKEEPKKPEPAAEKKPEQPAAVEPKAEEPKPAVEEAKPETGGTVADMASEIEYPEVGASNYEDFQKSLLGCYRIIKDRRLGDEGHKKVLAKYKVASVREIELPIFHKLIMDLEDKMLKDGQMSATEHAISRSLRPKKL